MDKQISFSSAVEGYKPHVEARSLSAHMICDYFTTFNKFAEFLEIDPPFHSITIKQIETLLSEQKVSKKTRLNYHTGLAALWTWAIKTQIVKTNTLHDLERPKPEERDIVK